MKISTFKRGVVPAVLSWFVTLGIALTASFTTGYFTTGYFTAAYANPRAPSATRSTAQAPTSGSAQRPPDDNLDVNAVNMQPAGGAGEAATLAPPVSPTSSKTQTSKDFNVTTLKTKKPAGAPHAVQLMNPPHRATYTPGVITFQWKLTLNTKKQKKFHFFITSVDGKTKIERKTKSEKRLMSLGPGQYKWRVVADSPKAESRWRSFKVIKLKSDEITRLYQGRSDRKPSGTGNKRMPNAVIINRGDPLAEGEPDPVQKLPRQRPSAQPPPSR